MAAIDTGLAQAYVMRKLHKEKMEKLEDAGKGIVAGEKKGKNEEARKGIVAGEKKGKNQEAGKGIVAGEKKGKNPSGCFFWGSKNHPAKVDCEEKQAIENETFRN
ncbi:hypothetical protein DKX38_008033 [Salix brachista]|uniref:Uncharacterized protein n=1 Tax=Salix brachista TaxID=2182728 RepID=A0A5N5MPU7_9ROSI|nr:hypothetical protein DKX38_008033 [Salix brachista]